MSRVWLFDLDGTLIDSMPTVAEILLQFSHEYGLSCDDEIVDMITPMGYMGVAKYFAELGVPMSAEEIFAIFKERTYQAYCKAIPLKKGVRQALEKLKADGDRLFVMTASPNALIGLTLGKQGMLDLFEETWSVEQFQWTKADKQLFYEIAERLGVSTADCVMVDDNVNVLKVAKGAGLRTVGVYDEFSRGMQDELRAVADEYILDFTGLLGA